jgi:hemerythrin-like domain-containing protein
LAKLDLDELRRQHRVMLVLATHLRGAADRVQTREDACEAFCSIQSLDRILCRHVRYEDDVLYPMLIHGPDPEAAEMAASCAEDFGSILGAWEAYRAQWTARAILASPDRFAAVTAGIIGGLAMRVDRENAEIYPAAERLEQRLAQDLCAAG